MQSSSKILCFRPFYLYSKAWSHTNAGPGNDMTMKTIRKGTYFGKGSGTSSHKIYITAQMIVEIEGLFEIVEKRLKWEENLAKSNWHRTKSTNFLSNNTRQTINNENTVISNGKRFSIGLCAVTIPLKSALACSGMVKCVCVCVASTVFSQQRYVLTQHTHIMLILI